MRTMILEESHMDIDPSILFARRDAAAAVLLDCRMRTMARSRLCSHRSNVLPEKEKVCFSAEFLSQQ